MKPSQNPSHVPDNPDELYDLMRACGRILYHGRSRKSGQGRILHILDHCGAVNQKSLQEYLGIQPGSISELLGKLEREGLIERTRDPADRRRMIVSLSEKGKQHADAFRDRQEENWFAALSTAQRRQLKELLQILLASWESENGPGSCPAGQHSKNKDQ